MKEKIANLIKVKSIVTIITVLVFSYLAVSGKLTGEQFMGIFSVIIAFYFGTQTKKNEDK